MWTCPRSRQSPKEEVSQRCGAETRGEKSSKGTKAARGSASEIRVKPIRCEWTFLLFESLSQASLSGFTTERSSEREEREPTTSIPERRSSDRRDGAPTEGDVRGRRACCGGSRSCGREGETSESSNLKGGFSVKQS